MENSDKITLLEDSLEAMLQENEVETDNYDQRLLAFIHDPERSSKLEHWNSQDESGNTLLHSAARYDNDIVAQYLIETGSEVNIQNNLGQTPLMIAIKNVSKKTIESLLAANADPNAMDNRHHSSLYYLYDFNRTHSDDHLQILNMLIDHGASLILTAASSSWSQIDLVLRYGNREAIEILLRANLDLSRKHEDNNTPVHILAKNANFEVFKALDDYIFEANVHNIKLQMPLYFAVIYGNVHTVQYLLDRHPDVSDPNGRSGSAVRNAIYNFNTTCGEREREQYAKCIELLLEQGSDIQWNYTGSYVTPMFKNIEDKLTYNTGKIAIAYLVVQEALGTEITDKMRQIINSNTVIKDYYEFCQQQLSTVIYNSVILLDLLSANEMKFELCVRNKVWASKMQDFCDNSTPDLHGLATVLQARIRRANRMIKLKRDSLDKLCSMVDLDYVVFHLAANKIISFLTKKDLHYLSRVSV